MEDIRNQFNEIRAGSNVPTRIKPMAYRSLLSHRSKAW